MTIRVHGAKVQGVVDIAMFEGRIEANSRYLDVLVQGETMVCDNKLIEGHFTFYNDEGDFVEGRFIQTSYSFDPLNCIHTHVFRSTSEINTPGNFQWLQRTTDYSRDGSTWATI